MVESTNPPRSPQGSRNNPSTTSSRGSARGLQFPSGPASGVSGGPSVHDLAMLQTRAGRTNIRIMVTPTGGNRDGKQSTFRQDTLTTLTATKATRTKKTMHVAAPIATSQERFSKLGRRTGTHDRLGSGHRSGPRHVALAKHEPSRTHTPSRSNAPFHACQQQRAESRASHAHGPSKGRGRLPDHRWPIPFHATPTDLARRAKKSPTQALMVTNPSSTQNTALLAADGEDLMINGALYTQGETTLVTRQTLPRPSRTATSANPLSLGGLVNETARS